ncbi:PHP domain-containing protein [Ancylomarina euxinus]|uniref:PHP domain-containing protein n=1 Tax=Ancylomarina euxinus TaxID=2283627 RepID=A0A425Y721_9BACT|nr:PHP domain-containing protein [Ancylomarina euxinus]MCZ4693976.1 PHP domain-containing protein [Ancylomarina euxinus]MUP14603.1 PHP domain-containing protein [Ancylomarina euxinus]RRG24150.1 PHP domain-containing protein [Ancylomarina euxinus]
MRTFRVDLHTHTVLSPCGDLEMSPVNIVNRAKERGIDILGISDHNITLHAPLIKELAAKEDIVVLMGAEVTTKEEVHCLCFFETEDVLAIFQAYLDGHLPHISNDNERFGYQVVVNEVDEIIGEVEWLLTSAIDQSIDQLEKKVHELDGLFIPAHINKMQNSIISQLGFIPFDLNVDALELTRHISKESFLEKNAYLKDQTFIKSSDAHCIELVGDIYTEFIIQEASFNEVKMALRNEQGRLVNL